MGTVTSISEHRRILRFPPDQMDWERDLWVEEMLARIDRDIENLLRAGIPTGWETGGGRGVAYMQVDTGEE